MSMGQVYLCHQQQAQLRMHAVDVTALGSSEHDCACHLLMSTIRGPPFPSSLFPSLTYHNICPRRFPIKTTSKALFQETSQCSHKRSSFAFTLRPS